MRLLGFRKARGKTIDALKAGLILSEDREAKESKNLLDTGEVSPEEVVAFLKMCRGSRDQYRESPHHKVPEIPVHEFMPVCNGVRWYIKVYFVEGIDELEPATFISVHRSQPR